MVAHAARFGVRGDPFVEILPPAAGGAGSIAGMSALSHRFVLASAVTVFAAMPGPTSGVAQPSVKAAPVRVVALPKMDGANLKVHAIQVTYPPGATSSAHRHPCPVFGYMISGTMRMQVSDRPPAEYKAGDSFSEMPTDVHRMATNPSADTPRVPGHVRLRQGDAALCAGYGSSLTAIVRHRQKPPGTQRFVVSLL